MITKQITTDPIRVDLINQETLEVPFILSKTIVDRDTEIIDIESMKLDNFLSNPIVLLQHNRSELPIGYIKELERDTEVIGANTIHVLKGIVKFTPTPDYKTPQIIFDLIERGTLRTGSIGMIFGPDTFIRQEQINGEEVRVARNVELIEFSIVNIPANVEAIVGNSYQEKKIKSLIKSVTEARIRDMLN